MKYPPFKIRPYARLLTMLGDQLIKNEQIALAELIKNAYDADAEWVNVNFVDFSEEGEILPDSKIVIEDNGIGMDLEVIEKSWMNPATPHKRSNPGEAKPSPKKNRIIQGEKGIGRFAILKLGNKIVVTTHPKDKNEEHIINFDFSQYDNDFVSQNGENKEIFLDDILIEVTTNILEKSTDYNNHGTKIEIYNLKGNWNTEKINAVEKESQKLQPLFEMVLQQKSKEKFKVKFQLNNEPIDSSIKTISDLKSLFDNSAVVKIRNGRYNEKMQEFEFIQNEIPTKISINDARIQGLTVFKSYFKKDTLFGQQETKCGDFRFNFYIFDLNAKVDSKYYLDKEEKKLIKEHRIYLYRDGIRVAPYGDPDNDWIGTDKKRAVGRSGDYLSNDQVVGFVEISKKENPNLQDKTNREGLIEEGNANNDFIALLQTILLYIRQHPYAQYKARLLQQEEQRNRNLKIVENKFSELEKYIQDNKYALSVLNDSRTAYINEKNSYEKKLDISYDLAGIGLSVETASHDMMMMLRNGMNELEILEYSVKEQQISYKEISKRLKTIHNAFSFVSNHMRNIQLLFKSSKQKKKSIKINDILEKVVSIYKRSLIEENIELIIKPIGLPIVVQCTDAVLFQFLINLFDNAVYWLSVVHKEKKNITITIDGDNQKLIFSDNGPGVNKDDKPYIFEAFYSGKEVGKGLGLYIARQLLNRMGFSIVLAEKESEVILQGANFVINFTQSEENE